MVADGALALGTVFALSTSHSLSWFLFVDRMARSAQGWLRVWWVIGVAVSMVFRADALTELGCTCSSGGCSKGTSPPTNYTRCYTLGACGLSSPDGSWDRCSERCEAGCHAFSECRVQSSDVDAGGAHLGCQCDVGHQCFTSSRCNGSIATAPLAQCSELSSGPATSLALSQALYIQMCLGPASFIPSHPLYRTRAGLFPLAGSWRSWAAGGAAVECYCSARVLDATSVVNFREPIVDSFCCAVAHRRWRPRSRVRRRSMYVLTSLSSMVPVPIRLLSRSRPRRNSMHRRPLHLVTLFRMYSVPLKMCLTV